MKDMTQKEYNERKEVEDPFDHVGSAYPEEAPPRFQLCRDSHIGIGVWWGPWQHEFDIALCLPFVTFCVGFGKPIGGN